LRARYLAYADQRTTNVNSEFRNSDPESRTANRLQRQVEALLGLFLVVVAEGRLIIAHFSQDTVSG
jgi:hypothetical protein